MQLFANTDIQSILDADVKNGGKGFTACAWKSVMLFQQYFKN